MLDLLFRKALHLWMYVMKQLEKDEEVQAFMTKCKELYTVEGDTETRLKNYSFYVHGWFVPWLIEQKMAGNLKKGKLSNVLMKF